MRDGRQLAFGLRRTIPLALPRDLAMEVACFVAEAMTRSHGATSPLMRSARKSTIVMVALEIGTRVNKGEMKW